MDVQYYCRRREQELALEASATSPEAASAHGVLALFYADKVRRMIASGHRLHAVSAESKRAAHSG